MEASTDVPLMALLVSGQAVARILRPGRRPGGTRLHRFPQGPSVAAAVETAAW